jgi:hypothetical protein
MPIIVGPSTHPPVVFFFFNPWNSLETSNNHDGQQWKLQLVTIWVFLQPLTSICLLEWSTFNQKLESLIIFLIMYFYKPIFLIMNL